MSFFNRMAQATGLSRQQAPKPGVPLALINYNPDSGQFEVGEEALQALRAVSGPVGVVAMSGRARQGKSFILNQLLGQSSGFQVAPTHRPCTKGLWMWSAPIERTLPDGSNYHLVLLDTEGIDAYDQTGQYSTQIFSLAVLLSSLFVYNQMGGIDEAALDRLSLVTEMTKHIRVRAGSINGDAASDLAEFTPSFLWLLRDFYLDLVEDGRVVTPKEYLETALQPLKGTGAAVEAKNQIRESIKSLFPDRDCITLVRPMHDEKQLTRLETLPQSQLRPEFREGLAKLTAVIFKRAKPKQLGPQVITGPTLAALTQAYITAINQGAVPTIATAWQGVAEAECRRAADVAEAAYHRTFNREVAAEESALDAEHARSLDAAQRAFQEVAIGEEAVKTANNARWRERVSHDFAQFRQQRLASAALECERMINDATARLMEVARAPGATRESVEKELARFDAEYRANSAARGPTKWQRHAEFMRGTALNVLQDMAAREHAQATRALEQATAQAQQAAKRAEQAAARERALQEELAQLHGEVTRVRADLARERSSRESASSQLTPLQQRLQQAEKQAATAKRQAMEARQTAAAQVAALEQQLQQLRTHQDSEAAGREREATARAQQAMQQVQAAQDQLAARQAELEKLQRQLHTAQSGADRWMHKYNAAEQARHQAAAERDAAVQTNQTAQNQLHATQLARDAVEGKLAGAQQTLKDLETRVAAAEANAQRQMEVDEGYATPPEGEDVNPAKMTIPQLMDWLTEHGHAEKVWDMSTRKAKKADYVTAVNHVLGH